MARFVLTRPIVVLLQEIATLLQGLQACLTPDGLLIDSLTSIIHRVAVYAHSDEMIWGALASGTFADGIDYEEPEGIDLISNWWEDDRPSPDIDAVIAEWDNLRTQAGLQVPASHASPERQSALRSLITVLDTSLHNTDAYISEIKAAQGRTIALLDRFNTWAHRLEGMGEGTHRRQA